MRAGACIRFDTQWRVFRGFATSAVRHPVRVLAAGLEAFPSGILVWQCLASPLLGGVGREAAYVRSMFALGRLGFP